MQKSFLHIVLEKNYLKYSAALDKLQMESLEGRRVATLPKKPPNTQNTRVGLKPMNQLVLEVPNPIIGTHCQDSPDIKTAPSPT